MSDALSFHINGRVIEVSGALADEPLLWVIRDQLKLKGTKYGCGHGGCGACTVQIDAHAATSCRITVKDATGKRIRTLPIHLPPA